MPADRDSLARFVSVEDGFNIKRPQHELRAFHKDFRWVHRMATSRMHPITCDARYLDTR